MCGGLHRHCGLDPQSRGAVDRTVIPSVPHRHSRVGGNPQDDRVMQVNKSNTTDRIPLSLDGRGIKGEGVPALDTGIRV